MLLKRQKRQRKQRVKKLKSQSPGSFRVRGFKHFYKCSNRTQHAEAKSKQAEESAERARDEAKIARTVAKELAPDYHQPGRSSPYCIIILAHS